MTFTRKQMIHTSKNKKKKEEKQTETMNKLKRHSLN